MTEFEGRAWAGGGHRWSQPVLGLSAGSLLEEKVGLIRRLYCYFSSQLSAPFDHLVHLLLALMAAASAMRPVVASMRAAMGASKRTFATANKQQSFVSRAQPSPRPQLGQHQLRQSFRRSYADAVKPKKSGFRVLRWAWRATYLSAIAGLGYTGYAIYQNRTPGDQAEPDPSKKTLVILGMSMHKSTHWALS